MTGTRIRFFAVGVWNSIFGYIAFICLNTLFADLFVRRYAAYMLAQILANILAIINAFISHKFITFRSNVRGLAVLYEFVRFSAAYLFSFLLSILLLPLTVEILHLSVPIAGALVLLACTVISYLMHSRFSFRNPAPRFPSLPPDK